LNAFIVDKPLLKFSVGIDPLSSKFCEGDGLRTKPSFFIANDYRVAALLLKGRAGAVPDALEKGILLFSGDIEVVDAPGDPVFPDVEVIFPECLVG